MTESTGLKTTAILCRLTPAERDNLRRKAAAYTAATGKPLSVSEAFREGAKLYLDDLLSNVDQASERVQGGPVRA